MEQVKNANTEEKKTELKAQLKAMYCGFDLSTKRVIFWFESEFAGECE
jgi:hypothetical protein